MSDLTIQWPDAKAEQVEAAKGRLDVARRRLSARSREGIVAVLGTVLDQWRDPQSKWRRRLLAELPQCSGFSAPVVSAINDAAHRVCKRCLCGASPAPPPGRWASRYC